MGTSDALLTLLRVVIEQIPTTGRKPKNVTFYPNFESVGYELSAIILHIK